MQMFDEDPQTRASFLTAATTPETPKNGFPAENEVIYIMDWLILVLFLVLYFS